MSSAAVAAGFRSPRSAVAESWEEVFHRVARPGWWIDTSDPHVAPILTEERLERFIGVLYLPETERWSHMFECRIGAQYDAVVHYEATRAVEPLERTAGWSAASCPRPILRPYRTARQPWQTSSDGMRDQARGFHLASAASNWSRASFFARRIGSRHSSRRAS